MKSFTVVGGSGTSLEFTGVCIASVEALNHDDTRRCEMRLYKTKTDYVCYRCDHPSRLDVRRKFCRCEDSFSVYQFFGTEPLANYLYGVAKIGVPGIRNIP